MTASEIAARKAQREKEREEKIARYRRISDAAQRMIEASAEQHLTWEEFDEAIESARQTVMSHSYVCRYPYPSPEPESETLGQSSES